MSGLPISGKPARNPFAPRNDFVIRVGSPRVEPTPAAQPTDVILARLAEMAAAQEAFRAEVRERLDALDVRVRRVEDAADCAAAAIEESERHVHGWIGEVIEAVDDRRRSRRRPRR